MPNIETKDRLIFALDGISSLDSAKSMVHTLADSVHFYKMGLELFMSGNYIDLIDWLKDQDKKIFIDLKFFDVPRTVAAAVSALDDKGAEFATVHGNDAIMRAACEAKNKMGVLAVTALTSLDTGDLSDLGFACEVESLVLSRAKRALAIGCEGVVSSGLEAKQLRQHYGDAFIVVTPGIRPVANVDDQKRVVDVEQAFSNGASYIVMGRPIRQAEDPKAMAMSIQNRIHSFYQ